MTTGKTIVLINLTFVGKIMSVLFLLSRFMGFPDSSVGKESTCNAGDPGLIPGQEDPLEKGSATRSSILGLSWWLSW